MAGGMLLLELIATRLFSVLFFYHYSFFAVSLVMSGLSFGGILASRWNVPGLAEDALRRRLAGLAVLFSIGTAIALLCLLLYPPQFREESPSTAAVALFALIFVPGLTCAGAFLAGAFARQPAWIGRLYAADLAAAAAACLGAILLLRVVQGPASLLACCLLASLAALWLAPRSASMRAAAALLAALSTAGMAGNVVTGGGFLRLPLPQEPPLERWNEHSRVILGNSGTDKMEYHNFVIDKTASTTMPAARRRPGDPVPTQEWWGQSVSALACRTGRPLRRVAVIGVGGGRDVLVDLANGAAHVDGYELNGILVDLLRKDYADFNQMASWPEVTLIHDEARVGIAHSGQRYDVIQATLIDTWAATAGGGFVLSENGLYTVEGWRTFLRALTETGVLTMTRFYLPDAPAETQRLVSLAAEALAREGVRDATSRVILASAQIRAKAKAGQHVAACIFVSRSPWSAYEVARIRGICDREKLALIAAPGIPSTDPVVSQLLDPDRRAEAIARSPFDLSAPTDLRPYFFLQLRPRDVMSLSGGDSGFVLEITFRAVRVMMLLGGLSVAFAAAVLALGVATNPGTATSATQRRLHRWMSLYFLGIGFGYILVQLGLHQRLTLILGHPTTALAVVLASMLLGTGAGSFVSRWLFPGERLEGAWVAMVGTVGLLAAGIPAFSRLEDIASPAGRALATGLLTGVVGLVLGFGFPLGVRLVAPAGERAVQKMWAINGAASIAGSSAAAIIGVGFGSRAVLLAALAFYTLAAVTGMRACRSVVAPPVAEKYALGQGNRPLRSRRETQRAR